MTTLTMTLIMLIMLTNITSMGTITPAVAGTSMGIMIITTIMITGIPAAAMTTHRRRKWIFPLWARPRTPAPSTVSSIWTAQWKRR